MEAANWNAVSYRCLGYMITSLAVALRWLMRTAVAGSALHASFATAQTCSLLFPKDAYPQYTNPQHIIGYDGLGYTKSGLILPEPIPLSATVDDSDRILVNCGADCYPVSIPGVWSLDWELDAPSGPTGAFVGASGSSAPLAISNSDRVLYLPPRLGFSGSQSLTIKAKVIDAGLDPSLADPVSEIRFAVSVVRGSEAQGGLYDVSVVADGQQIAPISPTACQQGVSPVCQLITSTDVFTPPTAAINDFPVTIGQGEIRPMRCQAIDVDRLTGECGTPPGYTPVSSSFDDTTFPDPLTYTWQVVPGGGGPGEGDGVFVWQGQAALFRGVSPGTVDVRVTVTAADGESATDVKQVTVVAPMLSSFMYGSDLEIIHEATGDPYSGPDWFDADLDGSAEGKDNGDRRFPVGYVAGDHAEIVGVTMNTGIATTNCVRVRATDSDGRTLLAALTAEPPMAPEFQILEYEDEFDAPLPGVVKRDLSYALDWEVSYGEDYWVDVADTTHPLYVVLAAPNLAQYGNSDWYRPFESVFDISCLAADGQASGIMPALWSHFAAPGLGNVKRKPVDGYNQEDGALLTYWYPGLPVGECQFLPDVLDPMNVLGDCKCGAWVQLLKACLGIHGVVGATTTQVNPPVGYRLFLVNNWEKSDPSLPDTDLIYSSQVVDLLGVAGQNNADPEAKFARHYVMSYLGAVYDPSYGVVASSEFDWEFGAIFGLLKVVSGAAYVDLDDPVVANLAYVPYFPF